MKPFHSHVLKLVAGLALAVSTHAAAADDEGEVAAQDAAVQPLFTEQRQPTLDLSIADVWYVLSAEQIEQALGDNQVHESGAQTPLVDQLEQVEVRAVREQHADQLRTPVPFGLASIIWAFYNPADAWRLFAPIES